MARFLTRLLQGATRYATLDLAKENPDLTKPLIVGSFITGIGGPGLRSDIFLAGSIGDLQQANNRLLTRLEKLELQKSREEFINSFDKRRGRRFSR